MGSGVSAPAITAIIVVSADGTAQRRATPSDPFIYHHKWLFVAEDYDRFNVEESRVRSQQWIALPNVDRSRIGRKSYWEEQVVPRIYQLGLSCEKGAERMGESLAKLQSSPEGKDSPDASPEDKDQWVNSTEARKRLKVSTCDLAHLRNAGKIESKKVGNAYYYKVDVGIDAHGSVDSTTK